MFDAILEVGVSNERIVFQILESYVNAVAVVFSLSILCIKIVVTNKFSI